MEHLTEQKKRLLRCFEKVTEYVVQKGDTLTSVALTHNISSKLVRVANPHVSDVLIENDILLLPLGHMDHELPDTDQNKSAE